jgi:hypothetical protein
MRTPHAILFSAIAGTFLLAQAPPRLTIVPTGRVLLGSAGPTERKAVTYTFTNTSAAPLRLALAEASPGVTVRGPALDGAFAPGQSLTLTLTVDPTGFHGFQARNVRLRTDDPAQGEYRLPVAVEVRPDLTVDATRKDLGTLGPLESPMAEFTFTRETGAPTAVRVTSALPSYLEAEVLPSGATTRLQCTLRAQGLPPGAAQGLETLEVETGAPLQPKFTLYLAWRFQHPIEALPSRVVFQDAATPMLELRLRARDGRPFLIAEATVEGGGFAPGPLPSAAASEQVLRVRTAAPAQARALLVLRFQGRDEILKVPLSYLPPLG